MPRTPKMTKDEKYVLRKLRSSRKRVVDAVERFGRLADQHNPPLPGHYAEAARRARAVRDAADEAIRVLEGAAA